MEELEESDMRLIAANHFAALPASLLERMIGFTRTLQREVTHMKPCHTHAFAPPTHMPHAPTCRTHPTHAALHHGRCC